jgi:hypothetical protein
MIIQKGVVRKVLLAEHRVLLAIREQGMTPDDFSTIDYLNMVYEAIEHPLNFSIK